MPVKVEKFRVRAGGETHFPGAIVYGLTSEEQESLVEKGICSMVEGNADSDNPENVMTIPQLKKFLAAEQNHEIVEQLLQDEESRDNPRTNALKMLADKLVELKDK